MSTRDAVFLEAADRIGARLCRDAIWSGRRCNWLGWALEVVGRSYSRTYRAQTSSLYDGTAGIALFLGRLSSMTGDAIQRTTAIGALNQALDGLPNIPSAVRSSFYAGASGIAFTAIQLGALVDDDVLVRRGLDEMERAAPIGGETEVPHAPLDVLGGSAGTILGLLGIETTRGRQSFIDIADRHGRRILEAASRASRGWSWDTMPGQSSDHLLGYGHGASGIGSALLALWNATGNEEFRQAALEGFRYERSFLSRDQHNWPDLRVMGAVPEQPVYAAAWCHGGPGIGLSRLRAIDLIDDPDLTSDLDEALQLTSGLCQASLASAPVDLCLCHGLGGNADLLIEAAVALGRPDLAEVAGQAARHAIAAQQSNDLPWPCGVTGGGETPNLMLGLAGIGHFFLRLHDPARVPSILSITPARTPVRAAAVA